MMFIYYGFEIRTYVWCA